jgi:hypothetical protein
MRKFNEPSCANLLRQPLVCGVSMPGALGLVFSVSLSQVLLPPSGLSTAAALSTAIAGYCALRLLAKYGKTGWEEDIPFRLEKLLARPQDGSWKEKESSIQLVAPETLDEEALLYHKQLVEDRIRDLRAKDSLRLAIRIAQTGARITELANEVGGGGHAAIIEEYPHWYSLHRLPVCTDPLWTHAVLGQMKEGVALVRIEGLDQIELKRSVERARRNNAHDGSFVSSIDSEVSFEEASLVLEGLSKGAEYGLSFSLVLGSAKALPLDPSLFVEEKNPALAVLSASGLRKRMHRSFRLRSVTAADLIPTFCDPEEPGTAILRSRRGFPLYFSPLDSRLEALHWMVVGASGSGKSFFTGLVLKRLLDGGEPIAVLFIDHNRSFRRVVRGYEGTYLEPNSLEDISRNVPALLGQLNPGSMLGIELSDLPFAEKKHAAAMLLESIEQHLRYRPTTHPVFVVLDECWNFLRDEPVLVQRAFREYRKLNGAVVAITQSLSDFLSTENGQSIFQNAPVRILLRQGEDLSALKGHLGFNEVELRLSRQLRQVKGEFSECLIKTPFLSRIGRLYPTPAEHELLRTDNIRAELLRENRMEELKCALP